MKTAAILAVSAGLLLPASSTAQTFKAQIDNVLASPHLSGAVVGVLITDKNGTVLYERNSKLRLLPASAQKIVTASYAFDTLGAEWQPRTRFWRTETGVTVAADGDPTLTQQQLQNAARLLDLNPLSRSVAVASAFQPVTPPGWEADDLGFTYGARPSALTVNNGLFPLRLTRGELIAPVWAEVDIDPRPLPGNEFDVLLDVLHRRIRPRGPMPTGDRALGDFPIPNPERAAILMMGGEPSDALVTAPTSSPVHTITGPTVQTLAKDSLEPSDNLYAEHLLLMAAAKSGSLGADPYAVASHRASTYLLNTVKLPERSFQFRDGSGLSRHNLITPDALARVLRHALRQKTRPEFIDAMAAPGEGTMRSRLKGLDIVAKTGTVSNVSVLAGIARPRSEWPLVFVVMVNSHAAEPARIREIQDTVVKRLLARSAQ